MKTYGSNVAIAALLIGMILFVFGCDDDSNPVKTFDEVIEKVPKFEDIPGAENATIKVTHQPELQSSFLLELSDVLDNDIINNGMYEAWCALWSAPIETDGREYQGVKLFLTKSDPKYNKLNYLLNNIQEYYRYYTGTNIYDIQIAIWELLDYQDFDFNEMDFWIDGGTPRYNRNLIDLILQDVNENGEAYEHTQGNLFAVFADMSNHITNDSNSQNIIIVTPDTRLGTFGATYRSYVDFFGNELLGVHLQIGGINITQGYFFQDIPQELSFQYIPYTGTTHQIITKLLDDNDGAIANGTTSVPACPVGSIDVMSFTMEAGPGSTVSFYDVNFNGTATNPPLFTVSDGGTDSWGIGDIDGSQTFTFEGMLSFTAQNQHPVGEIKVLIGCP